MENEANEEVVWKLNPKAMILKNEQRSYNGGYLFLQKIYHELGLDYICKKIEMKHKNKYDLSEILSMLLYTRVLYPGSKLSSLEDAKRLIEQPSADMHQVYRALSLLATEFNEVQADVYKRSLKLGKRDTRVVYYDLTNYFFEWEEEQALIENFSLNQDMIDQESRFDGFYGICTDLEGSAPEIIKINGGRWIIENGLSDSHEETDEKHNSTDKETRYR